MRTIDEATVVELLTEAVDAGCYRLESQPGYYPTIYKSECAYCGADEDDPHRSPCGYIRIQDALRASSVIEGSPE